jgi:hypothetical protein
MAVFWRRFYHFRRIAFGIFYKLILVKTAQEAFGLAYILGANLVFAL